MITSYEWPYEQTFFSLVSETHFVQDTLNLIQLVIRTVMYFNPLKIFLPFAFLFIIPGLAFLFRDLINLNLAQTSVLLLVNGGIILAIGMLADLINKRL